MTSEEMEFTIEPSRRKLLLVGGFVLFGLLAIVLIFGGGQNSTAESAEPDSLTASVLPALGDEPLAVGDLAYDFRLQDPDGNHVQLSDHLGRPIIVNFWATWCAPCRSEMPEFQAAQAQHGDDGLVILALDQNESAEAVAAYFEELGLTFTPLLDDGAEVGSAYGAFNLPTTVFIDRQGEVAGIHRGLLLQEQLDEQIEAILN